MMKNLDFKRAFDFVRSGENWYLKLLIGGLFYCLTDILNFYITQNKNLPIVPLIIIFVVILGSIPAGYLIQVSHNEINNKSNILPDWNNFVKYIKYALFLVIPTLVYFLPIGILVVVITISSIFLIKQALIFTLLPVIAAILVLLIALIPVCLILAILLNLSYSENLKLNDCFKILRMFKLFKIAFMQFLVYFGISLMIFAPIIFFVVSTEKNILSSISGFISFPAGIFLAHLSAQAYKYALSKEKDLTLAPTEPQID